MNTMIARNCKKSLGHLIKVVSITAIALSLSLSTVCAATYSPGKAAKYGRDYAHKSNPKYYTFPTVRGGDCTNYVSQCVVHGGKNMVRPKKLSYNNIVAVKRGYFATDDTSRWYHKKYAYNNYGRTRNFFCVSTSFTTVNGFYQYWKRYSKGQFNPPTKNGKLVSAAAKNSALQKALKLGDIVQVWESGHGWHHSMIVTGGSKGNWNVSYHSIACCNRPLNTQGFARVAKYRIIRIQ